MGDSHEHCFKVWSGKGESQGRVGLGRVMEGLVRRQDPRVRLKASERHGCRRESIHWGWRARRWVKSQGSRLEGNARWWVSSLWRGGAYKRGSTRLSAGRDRCPHMSAPLQTFMPARVMIKGAKGSSAGRGGSGGAASECKGRKKLERQGRKDASLICFLGGEPTTTQENRCAIQTWQSQPSQGGRASHLVKSAKP